MQAMMDSERFDYLINGYFDGELSSAECEELDALVLSDSRVREAYWEFALAHAALRLWGEQRAGRRQLDAASHQVHAARAMPEPLRSSVWQRFRIWGMCALVATVLVAGILTWISSRRLAVSGGAPNSDDIADHRSPGPGHGHGTAPQQAKAALQPIPSHASPHPPSAAPIKDSSATAGISHPSTAVARLVRAVDIRWAKGAEPVSVGGDLVIGQQLRIESGAAEIVFTLGVELRLQGPASLTVESNRRVFLADGRMSARITRPEGRNFSVRTPRPAVVEGGSSTQVASGGPSPTPPGSGSSLPPGRAPFVVAPKERPLVASGQLTEDHGLWLHGETEDVNFVADARFGARRVIDHPGHDSHTVAYWRFEEQSPGTLVPDTDGGKKSVRGAIDSSGNGNDLYTWNTTTAPRFSDDVAATTVAQTGKTNRGSLDNSAPLAPNGSRDMYTKSSFSHAGPIDLQRISPKQWTIEASVKPARLPHQMQVCVGRDGSAPGSASPLPARLGLGITHENHFVITFYDADRRPWWAVAERLSIAAGHWYHMAATSDGRVLRLYVDANDGRGYQLQATSALAATGNTALGVGDDEAEWSIGRGKSRSGQPTAWFQGSIDEVRISDGALRPSEFLFAGREANAKSGAE
jgi:hypothetical protein